MKKIDYFFVGKELLNIIYLHDEEDNERLDHVLFFEKKNSEVVGLYIRGMNPLLSSRSVYELDDFNLFASYEKLVEVKEDIRFEIKCTRVYFNTQYNELFGLYLANADKSCSIVIAFLQDEMYVEQNCSEYEARQKLSERFPDTSLIIYEKNHEQEWKQIDLGDSYHV
ncbi:hypothetical protein [Paenibacillus bovis]